MRISDWSSDVCSSDLFARADANGAATFDDLRQRAEQMPDCAVEIGMQLGQRAVGIIRHHMRQIALRQCGQTSADGVDRHLSLAIALLLCFRPLLVGREQGLETLQCLCKLADFITSVSARRSEFPTATNAPRNPLNR